MGNDKCCFRLSFIPVPPPAMLTHLFTHPYIHAHSSHIRRCAGHQSDLGSGWHHGQSGLCRMGQGF